MFRQTHTHKHSHIYTLSSSAFQVQEGVEEKRDEPWRGEESLLGCLRRGYFTREEETSTLICVVTQPANAYRARVFAQLGGVTLVIPAPVPLYIIHRQPSKGIYTKTLKWEEPTAAEVCEALSPRIMPCLAGSHQVADKQQCWNWNGLRLPGSLVL